jgi:hypothetical protein
MKKIISLILIVSLVLPAVFLLFEPILIRATAPPPAADTVIVTQAVTAEITISAPADMTMAPSIPGMTGGIGDGSVAWTVTTNRTAGYTLSLRAAASPALTRTAPPPADSFADYTPAVAGTPDIDWSIPAAASEFGFTVDGADSALLFRRGGTVGTPTGACGSAAIVDPVGQCWINTATAAPGLTIAFRTSATPVAGIATTVPFRAQVTPGRHQLDGAYTATITATATMN